METFPALRAICAGDSPVPGEFPTQRPATRRFGVFFDLRLNKGLRKQPWGWWFETLSRPLWRHCNARYGQTVQKEGKYRHWLAQSASNVSCWYSYWVQNLTQHTWWRHQMDTFSALLPKTSSRHVFKTSKTLTQKTSIRPTIRRLWD